MEGLKSMHWAVASNHFEAWLCPRKGAFSADSHFGISDFAHFWANVYQCGRFVAGKSGKWPCPSDNRGGPDRNGWSTKIGSASPSLWGVESQQLPDTLLLQRIPMGETKLVIVHQCPPQGLYRAAGTWQIVAVLILSLKYSRHNYILLCRDVEMMGWICDMQTLWQDGTSDSQPNLRRTRGCLQIHFGTLDLTLEF